MLDKFDITVSPVQWSGALHLHTTVVRTLATPHVQGEFTSWKDALGLQTVTPYIARVRVTRFPSAYARAGNPPDM